MTLPTTNQSSPLESTLANLEVLAATGGTEIDLYQAKLEEHGLLDTALKIKTLVKQGNEIFRSIVQNQGRISEAMEGSIRMLSYKLSSAKSPLIHSILSDKKKKYASLIRRFLSQYQETWNKALPLPLYALRT